MFHKLKVCARASILSSLFLISQVACANPYWDFSAVPKDHDFPNLFAEQARVENLKTITNQAAIDILRVQVDWQQQGETYKVAHTVIESSGTDALLRRSVKQSELGSYLGVLKNPATGQIYYDSVGTGKEYRTLTRAINFRFPAPTAEMTFELFAENPKTGDMEKVVSQTISPKDLQKSQATKDVVIKELLKSNHANALEVTIYAEGYLQEEESDFWQHALKAVQALQKNKFPGVEFMNIKGVFHASNKKLGVAQNLGFPIPEFDTFLGLYYPYWANLTRWYNVIYPTDENKLRTGFASAAYDYPIVLVNSKEYWGIGNYMAYTAVPSTNSAFTFILLHELGHFFGLNEEYEGGGPTELEFAPGIAEPWSQNITFLKNTNHDSLKWKSFVSEETPLPTPSYLWQSSNPVYGAYEGGYGDSAAVGGHVSYKPGMGCTMERYSHFCPVCVHAIEQEIQYSLGN